MQYRGRQAKNEVDKFSLCFFLVHKLKGFPLSKRSPFQVVRGQTVISQQLLGVSLFEKLT